MLSNTPHRDHANNDRALHILARTLFKEMQAQGYSHDHMVSLSSKLLDLVRDELRAGLAAE